MRCRQQFADILADAGFVPARRRAGGRGGGGGGGGGDGSDANSGNVGLVRAVICAGLYPNVVRVRRPEATFVELAAGAVAVAATARELVMTTREDGRVFLHPGSVNFSQGEFPSPWLVYHEKQVLHCPAAQCRGSSATRSR
jgi:ATP-dependent RNA helicase DHX57